jgi:hypothetical protein
MIPVKHIDPEDLPLYAMQLLPPDEMEEMTANLQYSREGRQRLAEVYEELAMYAHSVDLETPPTAARQVLLRQLARENKVVPIEREVGPSPVTVATAVLEREAAAPRSRTARILPWVGWAVAAGLAVEAGHLYQRNAALDHDVAMERTELSDTESTAETATAVLEILKDPSAQKAVLTSSELKPPPEGRVAYNPQKGSLVFLATNLAALPPSKVYELWVIPAEGHSPIPAGTFHPDAQGYASVILPELPKGEVAGQFGVTIEDAGGSATPTSPIVLGGKPA